MINAPAPFPGTEGERAANMATHDFDYESDRCMWCDCRPWGRIAAWPCGTDVPRVDDDGRAATEFTVGFALYAALKEATS